MSMAILGMGTAVPPTAITQDEALQIAKVLCCRAPTDATWLPLMYGQTGINSRRISLSRQVVRDVIDGTRHSQSVFLPKDLPDDPGPSTAERMQIYEESAPVLALEASRKALTEGHVNSAEITHLVTVSCTGFFAPGVDYALIQQLELKSTVQRTHIGFMGCQGAVNGLRVAQAFADADANACVLLCAVELSSLHYHYGWDPQQIVANALFGDGAAALVGRAQSPASSPWRIAATGSCLLPDSEDAMSWRIGDRGFAMTLSKNLPNLIARHLRPWLENWLETQGLHLDDIRSWIIHPGGPRVLSAVEESLGLFEGASSTSREIFSEYGNMSSPTILFILERLRIKNAARPAIAIAFGPGLVAEAALIL